MSEVQENDRWRSEACPRDLIAATDMTPAPTELADERLLRALGYPQ